MCSDKRINLKTFANSLFPGASIFRWMYVVYKSDGKLVVNCVFHYDSVAVTSPTHSRKLPRSRRSLKSELRNNQMRNKQWWMMFFDCFVTQKIFWWNFTDKKLSIKSVVLTICVYFVQPCPALACHISNIEILSIEPLAGWIQLNSTIYHHNCSSLIHKICIAFLANFSRILSIIVTL